MRRNEGNRKCRFREAPGSDQHEEIPVPRENRGKAKDVGYNSLRSWLLCLLTRIANYITC